ncbi:MAG: preprotein translocase subunit SecE [Pseudomonadales bacterium]
MNVKAEEQNGRFDAIKWILVGLVVAAGVAGNVLFADQSLLYRVLGLLVLAVIAFAIAAQTVKGAALWALIQGSRTEIRKVVWPSHQETLQTTAIVLVVVVIMALLLWGLDSLLSWAVAEIIG